MTPSIPKLRRKVKCQKEFTGETLGTRAQASSRSSQSRKIKFRRYRLAISRENRNLERRRGDIGCAEGEPDVRPDSDVNLA
jgi:hypothetical protein